MIKYSSWNGINRQYLNTKNYNRVQILLVLVMMDRLTPFCKFSQILYSTMLRGYPFIVLPLIVLPRYITLYPIGLGVCIIFLARQYRFFLPQVCLTYIAKTTWLGDSYQRAAAMIYPLDTPWHHVDDDICHHNRHSTMWASGISRSLHTIHLE